MSQNFVFTSTTFFLGCLLFLIPFNYSFPYFNRMKNYPSNQKSKKYYLALKHICVQANKQFLIMGFWP